MKPRVVALALLLLSTACGSQGEDQVVGAPPPAASQQSSGQDTSGEVVIGMVDDRFEPDMLTVKAGTKVTASNRGQSAHNWVSQAAGLDSENMDPGDRHSFTFNKPGTYEFVCTYHPGMDGRITVQ